MMFVHTCGCASVVPLTGEVREIQNEGQVVQGRGFEPRNHFWTRS
jgi:hypothetical protein